MLAETERHVRCLLPRSSLPAVCEGFLTGLPLMVLGDIEIPSGVASQGIIVEAANSYTSYKELWVSSLKLKEVGALSVSSRDLRPGM